MNRGFKLLIAGLVLALGAASRHPDRMPTWDLAKLVSFNRGDASDMASGSFRQTPTLFGNAAVSGRVLVLDGAGDYVTYPDAAQLDMPSAFTVSTWFQPSSPAGSWRSLCAKERTTGNQRSFIFGLNYPSGRYEAGVNGNGAAYGAANSVNYFFAATLPTSGWHHFVCVYDAGAGNGNRLKLWVNGAAVAATTLLLDAANQTPFNCDRELQVGAYDGTLGWKGNLDDFRLYRRALTAAEVGAIYSAGRD